MSGLEPTPVMDPIDPGGTDPGSSSSTTGTASSALPFGAQLFPASETTDPPACDSAPTNGTWDSATLITMGAPVNARLCPTSSGLYFRTTLAQSQESDLVLDVIFAEGANAQNYDFDVGSMHDGGTVVGFRCAAAAGVNESCTFTLPETGPVYIRAFSTGGTTREEFVTLILRSRW